MKIECLQMNEGVVYNGCCENHQGLFLPSEGKKWMKLG